MRTASGQRVCMPMRLRHGWRRWRHGSRQGPARYDSALFNRLNAPVVVTNGSLQPPPHVVVLDAELEPQSLSRASQFGLPSEWVTALVNYDPERRQVLRVRSCVAGSHAATVFKDGDLLLAIQDRVVSSFRDVEERLTEFDQLGSKRPADAPQQGASSKRPRTDNGPPVPAAAADGQEGVGLRVTICRDGHVSHVWVQPAQEDGMGTDRLVHWCGAQVQVGTVDACQLLQHSCTTLSTMTLLRRRLGRCGSLATCPRRAAECTCRDGTMGALRIAMGCTPCTGC